jgi:trans-aconitate methyltransferase
MSNSVRFAKVCPTCGRTLQIPVELIGKDVCCHGCGAGLRATVSENGLSAASVEGIDERVDRLIQAADKQLQHFTPSVYPKSAGV